VRRRQRHGEQRRQQRHNVLQGQAIRPQRAFELGQLRRRGIVALPLEDPLHMLHHWIERTVGVIRRTPNRHARKTLAAHLGPQGLHQGRFADPGLAPEQHHLSEPRFTLLPAPAQQPQFLVPPHQEDGSAGCGRLLIVSSVGDPEHTEHLQRLGHPFERVRPQGLQGKTPLHQPRRDGTEHHRIGGGQSLQARGNIRRLPHGQLFVPVAAAHVPNHRHAGMHPEAHLHAHAVARGKLGRV
jgi:hypothetical protein